MKKLIILLLFIPLVSIGQDDVTVVAVKSETKINTNIENELVLSDEKTTIKTPLTAVLSNYTHLLLVDVNLSTGFSSYKFSKYGYDTAFKNRYGFVKVNDMLAYSIFEVVNPIVFNKKRFRKEPLYLKSIKKESYLYMYVNQSQGRGDDVNTTFIIRDWKNKQIYNATHINTGLNEILAPLIDY
tara:strand:+ start:490 stop:1041 length:552 start_codon:yes stop_codon:yes gene_type:complete